jgi:hypothetical protein
MNKYMKKIDRLLLSASEKIKYVEHSIDKTMMYKKLLDELTNQIESFEEDACWYVYYDRPIKCSREVFYMAVNELTFKLYNSMRYIASTLNDVSMLDMVNIELENLKHRGGLNYVPEQKIDNISFIKEIKSVIGEINNKTTKEYNNKHGGGKLDTRNTTIKTESSAVT